MKKKLKDFVNNELKNIVIKDEWKTRYVNHIMKEYQKSNSMSGRPGNKLNLKEEVQYLYKLEIEKDIDRNLQVIYMKYLIASSASNECLLWRLGAKRSRATHEDIEVAYSVNELFLTILDEEELENPAIQLLLNGHINLSVLLTFLKVLPVETDLTDVLSDIGRELSKEILTEEQLERKAVINDLLDESEDN